MKPKIEVVKANALAFKSDALILKHAQRAYGVDAAVSNVLQQRRIDMGRKPTPGSVSVVDTDGRLGARFVVFVGVVPLPQFDYGQIRNFGYLGLQGLKDHLPEVRHVSVTPHGAGIGLDEREAFLALYAGVQAAIKERAIPRNLERISFVELNKGRAERLAKLLAKISKSPRSSSEISYEALLLRPFDLQTAWTLADKPHVFVAMPFSKGKMEDVFGFGIQGPIQDAGLLCERVDMESFTGEIMQRVKERIETAALIVADLTGSNANVYLEVGYAWGRGRPTLFLLERGSELMFDVQGHRCLYYENITDLAKQLRKELPELIGHPSEKPERGRI